MSALECVWQGHFQGSMQDCGSALLEVCAINDFVLRQVDVVKTKQAFFR